jgi:hypothetical protein
MTDTKFTYDIALPDGTVRTISVATDKPYLVVETRRTQNLIYNYWLYKTPTGASQHLRRLLERQQADAERYANYDINEASFQLASPKEMD